MATILGVYSGMDQDMQNLNDLGVSEEALLNYIFKQKNNTVNIKLVLKDTNLLNGENALRAIRGLKAKGLVIKINDEEYKATLRAKQKQIFENPSYNFLMILMTAAILILTLILVCRGS